MHQMFMTHYQSSCERPWDSRTYIWNQQVMFVESGIIRNLQSHLRLSIFVGDECDQRVLALKWSHTESVQIRIYKHETTNRTHSVTVVTGSNDPATCIYVFVAFFIITIHCDELSRISVNFYSRTLTLITCTCVCVCTCSYVLLYSWLFIKVKVLNT